MPPKKTSSKVILSSSDAPAEDEKIQENKPDVGSAGAASSSRKFAAHPPTMTMVKDALKELDTKKGTSSQAIRKYIIEKYPSMDGVRFKYTLRNALVKGMESGVLVRPANSHLTSGAHGSFRLAPKKAKQPKLETAENTDPNIPKATKDGAKKPKGSESGAGAVKEKAAVRKKDKSSEDSKPSKKAKVDKGAAASKVPPAKKPKAKKVAVGGGGEEASDVKVPTSKAAKGEKVSESKAAKGSKKKAGDKDKAPVTKAGDKAPVTKAGDKDKAPVTKAGDEDKAPVTKAGDEDKAPVKKAAGKRGKTAQTQ